MVDQVVERADTVVERDRDRAGADHHHAQARQHAHGAEQPAVVVTADRVEPGCLLCRLARGFGHKRTFNVARPTSTSPTEMIHKRTINIGRAAWRETEASAGKISDGAGT